MRSFTGLWSGSIAGLVVLLWGSVGIAQSLKAAPLMPSANTATVLPIASGTARPTQQSSTDTRRSLVCDATGNVCVAVQMLHGRPSPLPTPASHPPDSLTIGSPPLICDTSGTICAHGPIAPPNPRRAHAPPGTGSPLVSGAALAAAVVARQAAQNPPARPPAPAALPLPSAKALEILYHHAQV